MGAPAWDAAEAAAAEAGVTLRPLTSLEDADDILRVMIATWGNHQLLPREMLVALAEAGDAPYGAFAEGELIGYVLGWAGVLPQDGLHMHSHMLATVPDRRHRGVGYALKLAQRARCLDQGIHLVRWTFDPMIARNAWLNLGKLGALADGFHRDFYGRMDDAINTGERSDRLVVRWELDRDPGPRTAPPGASIVEIPRDHETLRRDDPAAAAAARDDVADRFEAHMGRGMRRRGLRSRRHRVRLHHAGRGARLMRIREVELRLIGLPLVRPFRTSFGVSTDKVCILVCVTTDAAQGWGECVADIDPGFSEEFNEGAWLVLRDFLAPALLRADDVTHENVESLLSFVRGNPMAKAALIDAVLDAELRERGRVTGLVPGERDGPRGVRGLGGHHRDDRRVAGPGRPLPDGRLPAHQAEDRARSGRGARGGRPRRAPGHPALGRRERGLHPGRRWTCSGRSMPSVS